MPLAILAALGCAASAGAQFFNVDLDTIGPGPWAGAPSDGFGGAANQAGRWNQIAATGGGPYPLVDLNGAPTGATIRQTGGVGGNGYNNPILTGDFARLLGDSAVVATLDGGHAAWTLTGFAPGLYELFTYAVRPSGVVESVPVYVPEATGIQTQIVTGPIPADAFILGVTHSIHTILVGGDGVFHVDISQPTNHIFVVNGFQVVAVPELSTAVGVSSLAASWAAMRVLKRRCRHKRR